MDTEGERSRSGAAGQASEGSVAGRLWTAEPDTPGTSKAREGAPGPARGGWRGGGGGKRKIRVGYEPAHVESENLVQTRFVTKQK